MDFLGPATHEPQSKDVARYVGLIRETVARKPKDQTLEIVTSLFHAIGHFAVHSFGHRETLAILKAVRTKVEETDTDARISPWR